MKHDECLGTDGLDGGGDGEEGGGNGEARRDGGDGDAGILDTLDLAVERLGDGHLHGGVDGTVDGLDDEGDGGEAGGGGDRLGDVGAKGGVEVRGGDSHGGGVHDAADEGSGPEHGGEHLPGEGVEGDDGTALGLLVLVGLDAGGALALVEGVREHVERGDAVGGGDAPLGEEGGESLTNLVGVAHVAEGGLAVDVELALGVEGGTIRLGGVRLDGEGLLGGDSLGRGRERVEPLGAEAAAERGGGDGGGGTGNGVHLCYVCV
mmetsp:Transcript_4678/g.19242  ORF Transcript_4678/g.19242 Transcript_4678/m.19242 type:complete len:263 (-) Transcript_4678:47-835(-)